MTYYQELESASPPGDTAITIGTFDGVHLGHQRVFQRLKSAAESKGLLSAVLTFRNHPRLVLSPDTNVRYVTTLEERLSLISAQGVDLVVPVEFTKELSVLKAREFLSLLSEKLKMKGIVAGPDFALGHRREGDIPALTQLGREMGFWVETLEHVRTGGSAISSNSLRSVIVEGDVVKAAEMLGRLYSLAGSVVEGEHRGKGLGFPTANLSVESGIVIPGDGIYAAWANVGSARYQAACNIGVRPTFGGGRRTVEAFILDFDGDLYGRPLTLEFANRLRGEEAFPTVDALVDQMKRDVDRTRAVLSTSAATVSTDA